MLGITLLPDGPANARGGIISIGASVTAAPGNSEGGSIDPQFGSGFGASVHSQYNSDADQVFTIVSSAFAKVGDPEERDRFGPAFHVQARAVMTGDPVVRGTATATASIIDELTYVVSPFTFLANPDSIHDGPERSAPAVSRLDVRPP